MIDDFTALKAAIKAEANRLGFAHCGVTSAFPAPYFETYQHWVASGYQGEMHYLAREDALAKRENPSLILEGCQSIICLAMPYPRPQSSWDNQAAGAGRLASYAITRDYHDRINPLLQQLADFISDRSQKPVQCRSYVDTGPVLERAYAVQAGLGGIGKNACLIIPRAGSFFFLAEILTDLSLPADLPYTHDLCKNCTRCIDACPTGCILPDRTIDANRCISYLTIENKSIIPDACKKSIGSWLIGCDVCQMVCPHNATPIQQAAPAAETILPESLELISLFSLDADAFKVKFGESPLLRAKRTGLLRNAAVVLGNQKLTQALPVLRHASQNDTDPGLKDACVWAIREIENG